MAKFIDRIRRNRIYDYLFHSREKREMELMEEITLGPIEKFIRFGRFPMKLLLAISITIIITVQTVNIYNPENVYIGQTTQAIRTFLFREGVELDEKLLSESLYSTPEFMCAMEWFVTSHASIGSIFTGSIYYSEPYIETPYPGSAPPLNVTFEWAETVHGGDELDLPASAQWTPDARMAPFMLIPSDESVGCADAAAVDQAAPYVQSLIGLRATFEFYTEYRPAPGRPSVILHFTGLLTARRSSLGQSPMFQSTIDISSTYVKLPPSRIVRVYGLRFALIMVMVVLCLFSNCLTAIAAYRSVGYYNYAKSIHRIALHNRRVRRSNELAARRGARAARHETMRRRELAAQRLEEFARAADTQPASRQESIATSLVTDNNHTGIAGMLTTATATAPLGADTIPETEPLAAAPAPATAIAAAAAAVLAAGQESVPEEETSSSSSDSELAAFYQRGNFESDDDLSESDEEFKVDILADVPLINGWHIVAFIATTCALAYNVIDLLILFTGADLETTRQLLLGLAGAFTWLNICRFFEYDKRLYIFFVQMKKGWGVISRYFISVLPLFMSFALLGLALFARFEPTLFPDLSQSIATLFSVLHGDSILDVFGKLYYDWPVLSRFYVIIFVTLFICIILATFIVICQDSFTLARKELYGKDMRRMGFTDLRGRLRGRDLVPGQGRRGGYEELNDDSSDST